MNVVVFYTMKITEEIRLKKANGHIPKKDEFILFPQEYVSNLYFSTSVQIEFWPSMERKLCRR